MKKITLIAGLLSALLATGSVAALAANDRATQFGPSDKVTPQGISPSWDITAVQMGIKSDNTFLFFATTKSGIANIPFPDRAAFTIFFDTDLDLVADYSLTSTGELGSTTWKQRSVIQKDGSAVASCKAFVGATTARDAFSWNLPKNCFYLRETMNVSIEATPDGIQIDRYPDGTTWWTVKTDFLLSEPCKSSLNKTKRIYQDSSYQCVKSGKKWAWKYAGPAPAPTYAYLTQKAHANCGFATRSSALLEDGGKTLTLDGVYKYFITASEFDCVIREMQIPASVVRKINITRALDGTLEASWNGIKAFWNYHPDKGLDITFSYN